MGRKGPMKTGLSVHVRHVVQPCGKLYSGRKETVNKLVSMHRKLCQICDDAETSYEKCRTVAGLPLTETKLKELVGEVQVQASAK